MPALLPGDPVTEAVPWPGGVAIPTVTGSAKPRSLASTSTSRPTVGPVRTRSGFASGPAGSGPSLAKKCFSMLVPASYAQKSSPEWLGAYTLVPNPSEPSGLVELGS